MLEYFAGTDLSFDLRVGVATRSRLNQELPAHLPRLHLPEHTRFGLRSFVTLVHRVWREIRTRDVDLVHAWAARDWPIASVAGRLCGVPVVGTLHDDPNSSYIRPRRRRIMRWNAGFGLDRIVCVSEALQTRCVSSGYAMEKLVCIRNGLPPLADVRPIAPGPDSNNIRVGYLGALSAGKGTDFLLSMLDRLWEGGTTNWTLHLGGGADAANSDWWERTWQRYAGRPWAPRVNRLGWVNSPSEYFGSIDLLVFPSRLFDCLPTVLIEAAQSGVPAVATAVGGTPEIVLPERTGWLFDRDDETAGCKLLRRVLANPSLIIRAGLAAKQLAESNYTVTRMVSEYADLYRSLLKVDEAKGLGGRK